MKHAFKILALVYLTGALWQSRQPAHLQMLGTYKLDAETEAFLNTQGQAIQLGQDGMRVEASLPGMRALSRLVRFERCARDQCLENLANWNCHLTPDGLPYRRRYANLRVNGETVVGVDENLAWVYDPCNPLAQTEGDHRGYVARSNVNVAQEARELAAHEERLNDYLRALDRLEKLNPNLLLLDGPNLEVDAPEGSVRFETLLQSMRST